MKKTLASTILLAMLVLTSVFSTKVSLAQETPLISVDPATVTGLSPSQMFTIVVKIDNVTGLYGFDIRLRWNPEILDYVSHTAKIPVNSFPGGVLYNPVFILKNEVNSTAGTYWLAASSLDPAPVFDGDGIFFEMTFHVRAVGRCLLELYVNDIADKNAQPIPHNVQNGFFSNYVATPADIYVNPTNVIDADLTPGKNFSVDVDLDDVVELRDFEFSLGYNTTILDVLEVTVNPIFPLPTVEISELDGLIHVAASVSPYISGNIVLATIKFNVTGIGDSILDLNTVTLVDDWGDPIPYNEPRDGFFSNVLRARLWIEPPAIIDPSKLAGSQFSVDVMIDDVFNLYHYGFNLSYDPSVLTCLGAVIFPPTSEYRFTTQVSINDETGEILIDVLYYSPAEPISLLSETRIVTIYFMVEGYGFSIIDLNNTVLENNNGEPIEHDVGDGFFQNLAADVAILSITASPNKPCGARPIVTISVVAANLGDIPATFTVTAYYSGNTIGTLPVIDLSPKHNTTVVFMWDTTGLPSCSNYTLAAEASPVLYELDLTNNYLEEGWVYIKIIGDVNGDGTVDIYDIVLASDAYGSQEGDTNYNPCADLAARFGVVDIFDMVTIASHYGESCP